VCVGVCGRQWVQCNQALQSSEKKTAAVLPPRRLKNNHCLLLSETCAPWLASTACAAAAAAAAAALLRCCCCWSSCNRRNRAGVRRGKNIYRAEPPHGRSWSSSAATCQEMAPLVYKTYSRGASLWGWREGTLRFSTGPAHLQPLPSQQQRCHERVVPATCWVVCVCQTAGVRREHQVSLHWTARCDPHTFGACREAAGSAAKQRALEAQSLARRAHDAARGAAASTYRLWLRLSSHLLLSPGHERGSGAGHRSIAWPISSVIAACMRAGSRLYCPYDV